MYYHFIRAIFRILNLINSNCKPILIVGIYNHHKIGWYIGQNGLVFNLYRVCIYIKCVSGISSSKIKRFVKWKVSFSCKQSYTFAPSANGIKKATSIFIYFLLFCFSVVFLGEGLNGQLAVAIDRCGPGSGRWVPLSLCWIIRFKH